MGCDNTIPEILLQTWYVVIGNNTKYCKIICTHTRIFCILIHSRVFSTKKELLRQILANFKIKEVTQNMILAICYMSSIQSLKKESKNYYLRM